MNVTVNTQGGSSQVAVGSSNVTQIQSSSDDDHGQLKEYIRFLYENSVEDIENSTVWEMAEQFFGYDLEPWALDEVFKLINSARVEVTVTW